MAVICNLLVLFIYYRLQTLTSLLASVEALSPH